MTLPALGLVLLAAILHATWNLLAKRAQGGAPFIWLYDLFTLTIFAPVVLTFILLSHTTFSLWTIGFIVGSGLLELAYFLMLQRGYRIGDLSLVYPLARGTGPLLTTIVAVLILHEYSTPLTLIGIACIIGGVMLITWKPQLLKQKHMRLAVLYGLLTGCCIAGYTLWDKEALTIGNLAPLVLYYGTVCLRFPLLTPFAIHHWPKVHFHWHRHRLEALGIAVFATFSYVLVLTALTFTPVSYVASTREVSVVFGTLLGTRFLAEGQVKRRFIAAAIIVIGIIALAL